MTLEPPFIVYALPRSRTAWLSHFLTYGGWTCHHETSLRVRSLDDIQAILRTPNTGVVETAAAQIWRILHHYFPELRTVVIRRPVDEVMASLMAVDLKGKFAYDVKKLLWILEREDRHLEEISMLPGTLIFDYADLARESVCADIFEKCLDIEFDREWWLSLKDKNIQIDCLAQMADYQANRPEIDELKASLKRELVSLARNGNIGRKSGVGQWLH